MDALALPYFWMDHGRTFAAAVVLAVFLPVCGWTADRFGARLILDSTGARPADPSRERVLLDVVREGKKRAKG